MTVKSKANPEVDAFIGKAKRWQEELKKLRAILLETELTEEIKWHEPCYTFEGRNVVILGCLKESVAFAFFKGALLKDPHGVLTAPGKHTQGTRWIKFSSVAEIAEMRSILKAYAREAIEVEKAGLKVDFQKNRKLDMPEELQVVLDEFPEFRAAFSALTPGRQRAYIYHFSQPKQAKTRAARVQKYFPKILNGKGLLDE